MPPTTIRMEWKQDVPILVRAMVLAGEILFLAGPPDILDERQTQKTLDTPETQKLLAKQVSVFEGSEGAVLTLNLLRRSLPLGDAIPILDSRHFLSFSHRFGFHDRGIGEHLFEFFPDPLEHGLLPFVGCNGFPYQCILVAQVEPDVGILIECGF